MANEVTIPLLPCGSIDDVAEFYRVLGFRVTYRQYRPNPYVAVAREDLHLHFFGMPDFVAADSYGSCLVYVPDVGELYRAFADGMRAGYGKVLVSGTPRMTRPRRRKNSDGLGGFSVIDPGGNWIRIFQKPGPSSDPAPEAPAGSLTRSLQNAIVLADSRGDHRQAARILDTALARADESSDAVEVAEVLVYRAEVAMVLEDWPRAAELLSRVRQIDPSAGDRQRLAAVLDSAAELTAALPR